MKIFKVVIQRTLRDIRLLQQLLHCETLRSVLVNEGCSDFG